MWSIQRFNETGLKIRLSAIVTVYTDRTKQCKMSKFIKASLHKLARVKLAYLILVHHQPKQLERLIRKLSFPGVDFYIHVDEKADIRPFLQLISLPQVVFIKKREKVNWGGYSIIKATINGFEAIISSGIDYQYITLLSGQDYPLKSNEAIQQFFTDNPRKAFISFLSIESEWTEALPRLQKYFLTDHPFAGSTRIEALLNKLLPARKQPQGLVFVGRFQWFSMTLEQIKYIVTVLQKNKKLQKYLRFTWGSDEFVFQTLLYNSDFRNQMVNDNLRYTNWTPGTASPKILTMDNANELSASDKLFARKFDAAIDKDVLDFLDNAGR